MRKSQPKSGRMIDVATGEAISLSEMSKAARKLPNVAGSVKVAQEALNIGCYALNDWLNYFQNGMRGAEPLVFRDEMKANKRLAHNDKAAVIKAMIEYCQRSQYAMQNILDRAQQNRKGMLTQSYRKADSGRQFIIGESLQSCTKLACMTALHGHYEYDFESCHQSIALELSKQWSECPSLETLEYVVNNKAAVRAELSNLTGQPISAVKSALIAPFFGATHTTWHKGAYIQTLTEQGYRQILKSELFQQYERDVQLFQFHLLDTCKRDSKMRAVNALGLVAPVGAGVKNEVAHLMQGYEVKAMRAATAATTSAVLWKHDAIVCANPEDVESMTQAVKKATGLTLQMSQQQYRLSGLPEV